MGVFEVSTITNSLRYKFCKALLPEGLEIILKPQKTFKIHLDLQKGTDYVYRTSGKASSSASGEQV